MVGGGGGGFTLMGVLMWKYFAVAAFCRCHSSYPARRVTSPGGGARAVFCTDIPDCSGAVPARGLPRRVELFVFGVSGTVLVLQAGVVSSTMDAGAVFGVIGPSTEIPTVAVDLISVALRRTGVPTLFTDVRLGGGALFTLNRVNLPFVGVRVLSAGVPSILPGVLLLGADIPSLLFSGLVLHTGVLWTVSVILDIVLLVRLLRAVAAAVSVAVVMRSGFIMLLSRDTGVLALHSGVSLLGVLLCLSCIQVLLSGVLVPAASGSVVSVRLLLLHGVLRPVAGGLLVRCLGLLFLSDVLAAARDDGGGLSMSERDLGIDVTVSGSSAAKVAYS